MTLKGNILCGVRCTHLLKLLFKNAAEVNFSRTHIDAQTQLRTIKRRQIISHQRYSTNLQ